MIKKIGQLLEEYGWTYKEFEGEKTGEKYILTFVNPNFNKSLKVVILIKEVGHWLYISTHKLFKYPKNSEVALRFLKFSSQHPLIKWFSREVEPIMYFNVGFEIDKEDFSKELFFKKLDIMTHYLNDVLCLLNKKGVLTEKNLTKIKEISKESLELN